MKMNFTLDQINGAPFFLYERASKSRKLSGYHVYIRCAFRSWDNLTEAQKIELMRDPLRGVIIGRLEEFGLLPDGFDRQNGDPFLIAPFSSDDLRADLRKVAGYYWRNASINIREAWNNRAERLNARPQSGEFTTLPSTLFQDNRSSEAVLRRILVKDFGSLRSQFDSSFMKIRQKKTLYNKVEHVSLEVKIDHKFYFYKEIPCSVMDSIFGSNTNVVGELFQDNERVKNRSSSRHIGTYHIFARDRVTAILSTSDVDLSSFMSYKDEVIKHHLCSYAIIKRIGRTQKIKCYGWETSDGLVNFIFSNFDNTDTIEVSFYEPVLEKNVARTNEDGEEKEYKFLYCFPNGNVSMCGNYEINYFCPVILQVNKKKMTLKLIASRCCLNEVDNLINTNYSS